MSLTHIIHTQTHTHTPTGTLTHTHHTYTHTLTHIIHTHTHTHTHHTNVSERRREHYDTERYDLWSFSQRQILHQKLISFIHEILYAQFFLFSLLLYNPV